MKKFLPAIFFLTVSCLMILIWFRDGRIFAGGDVGFQTFNPKRILGNAKFIWWDSTAPGSVIPQGLTAIPLQFSLTLLQLLGFPPVALQATLFLVLLFAMGFGMYLFLAEKLKTEPKLYPLAGGLFYMFNPYMMIQVWHRFIHTTIILAATLPFLAIFWDKWVKYGKLKYLIIFLISSFLAVYAFGTYAFIVTVWIFLTLLAISNLLPWSTRKLFLEIGVRFLFGFIIWILLNSWWFLPVVKISPALLSIQHKLADNLTNLIMISSQAILPYSIQLINPFYAFYQAEFGDVYRNHLFQIIPWIFVVVILVGLMHSFKTKVFSLFGIFFLLAIFLAKGAASPFGALYIFGFKNFFALGVLRNPFEKTGLILVFFATVLFVLGVSRFKNKAVLMIALASVLIFSWPMLFGRIFGAVNKRGDVEVPQSYKLADFWLMRQRDTGSVDGNILHLPLTRGEAVGYNWEFGYNGLEPSDQFFTAYPSISRGFNIQRVDDSLTALSLIFHKPYFEDKDKILRLLQAFNVRFIVLHKDLYWFGSDVYDPLETEKVLDSLSFVEKKEQFGNLVIYQVADQFFGPKIEIRSSASLVYPQNINMKVWPWLADQGDSFFVSPIQEYNLDFIESSAKSSLVFPKYTFTYPELSKNKDEIKKELMLQLNSVLSSVKYLEQQGIVQPTTEEIVQNLVNSSDKLVKIYQAFIDKTPGFQSGFEEYVASLEKILPQLVDNSAVYFDSIASIDGILKYHWLLLADLERQLALSGKVSIVKAQDLIKGILSKKNIIPTFVVLDQRTEFGQREYKKFWINSDGKYELLLSNSKTRDAYVNNLKLMDFQINSKKQSLEGKVSGNLISFGEVLLSRGLNEISFTNPTPINLISSFEDLAKVGDVKLEDSIIQMNVTKENPTMIESSLFGIGGEDIYQVNFEAQLPTNIALYLQVIQDTDPEENGQKVPRVSSLIAPTQPVSDWQSYSIKLPPLSLTTRVAKVRLIAVIQKDQDSTNTGKILIRNFRVLRVLNNDIFLRKKDLGIVDEASYLGQIVNFKKNSSVDYEGEVNLPKAGYLFFKETYHPGWKLLLVQGNKIIKPKEHLLGDLYGNVWYIDNGGEYKFRITFEPQKYFSIGVILTGVGLLGILIYAIIAKKIRKE